MTVTDAPPEATLFEAPPQTLPIWDLTPDARIAQRIRRFGIEYEMFPHGYRGGDGGGASYCCEDCDGDYEDWLDDNPRIKTDSPIDEYVSRAADAGLANYDVCAYHCNCGDCDYERDSPLMATQEDCSVGIEMVSRILDVTNEHDMNEVAEWIRFIKRWKADGGWMPDGNESCGNHIHVERTDCNRRELISDRGRDFVNAAYAAYGWDRVADGGCGRLRRYNNKPISQTSHNGRIYFNGSWVSWKDQTIEHRLWNTPLDPERLWAHLGLSIALTRWGAHVAAVSCMNPAGWWIADFAAHIDDFKAAVIAYLPTGPRFEPAAQLLTTHLVNY